jgi:HEPN domain-containing protein
VKRKEFQELAALRLKEARLLLKANCPEGAYYLAGYAAECALKACIARRIERFEFPDLNKARESWKHDLSALAKTAGLEKDLAGALKRDPELNLNWQIVTNGSRGAAIKSGRRMRRVLSSVHLKIAIMEYSDG